MRKLLVGCIFIGIVCLGLLFRALYTDDVGRNNEYKQIQTTSEVKEVNKAEAMNAGDLAKNFNFSVDQLEINDINKDWTLVGVDAKGYYFLSNENDHQVTVYYYDKSLALTKSMAIDVGNSIYVTYYFEGKIYIIIKDTDSQPNEDVVTIQRIDPKSNTIETIYEDKGKKFPEYYFYENKVILANIYDDDEQADEQDNENDKQDNDDEQEGEVYRITSIDLVNNESKRLKSVSNKNEGTLTHEEILRIGGSADFLYKEVVIFDGDDQEKEHVLHAYDLKNEINVAINLKEPIDFISGDENFFVSRTYAADRPISNSAISFTQYNQQSDAYDQHVIYNTDSTNHPYALYKTRDYHVLMLTFDIVVVDMKHLEFDTINYRSRIKSENISPPFVVDHTIYYMKKRFFDEKYHVEIYSCEL